MTRSLPTVVRTHLSALRILLVLTVVTGVLYPLAVTGVAQGAFPHEANGSRITRHGTVLGSSLIGQNFALPKTHPGNPNETLRPDPAWFQPRPSAGGYDPLATGASNLGPNNPLLVRSVEARRAAVARFDGVAPRDVPADAVTASGSGLDPHISPAYAYEQVNRVARTRGLRPATVHALVTAHVEDRVLGFLGERRVNVVQLNAALADHR